MLFAMRGQTKVACGIAAGAAIGLFSLWSLIGMVLTLTGPGKERGRILMAVLAFVKLPILGVAIYYATASRYISPMAMLAGVALVPAVITLKVVGYEYFVTKKSPMGDDACRNRASLSG